MESKYRDPIASASLFFMSKIHWWSSNLLGFATLLRVTKYKLEITPVFANVAR
jgi:hypothetical protein